MNTSAVLYCSFVSSFYKCDPSVSGEWSNERGGTDKGTACADHGDCDGDLFSSLLAALRDCGPDSNFWKTWPDYSSSKYHPIHPCKEQHSLQSDHLHIFEQTGK